jgi:tRNA-specific 2-thiouridylase
LCQVNQSQLAKAIFPIGELTKPEVRKIAEKIGLTTAGKKDSQGLCFVGKVRLPDFLQQQLEPQKGNVILIEPNHPQLVHFNEEKINLSFSETKTDLQQLAQPYHFTAEDGKVIGQHNGAHFYTIGQRKGFRYWRV